MTLLDLNPNDVPELKRHVRKWVTPSSGAEMICAALTVDTNVAVKVLMDERGIAAAASLTVYKNRIHVFSLGSVVRGAGSRLLTAIEDCAGAMNLPVTVAAIKSAEGYYAKRGYKKTPGQKAASIVRMKKKC